MRRRPPAAAVCCLFLAALGTAGCEPAPDQEEWARLEAMDEAEELQESLEENTGELGLEPVCESCSITLESVATLGAPTDPAGFDPMPEVAADEEATRFYVFTRTLPGQIMVYGEDGTFTGTLGREGEGPGEFGGELMLATGPGDSLHVAQTRPARYSVWTPDGQLARSVNLAQRFTDFALLPTGTLALNAVTAEGWATVLLSPTGEELGRLEDGTPAGEPASSFRRLGVGGDWLWATSMDRFQLNAWDEEGHLRLHREADPDWEPPPGFNPGLRPDDDMLIPGQASGITGNRDTRVYVLTALPPQGVRFGEISAFPYTRTLVQYVQYGRDEVFAASIVDGFLMPLGGDLAYRVRESANGERRIEVVRLQVRG